MQSRLKENGILPGTLIAAEFARFEQAESVKWLEKMKRADMQPRD